MTHMNFDTIFETFGNPASHQYVQPHFDSFPSIEPDQQVTQPNLYRPRSNNNFSKQNYNVKLGNSNGELIMFNPIFATNEIDFKIKGYLFSRDLEAVEGDAYQYVGLNAVDALAELTTALATLSASLDYIAGTRNDYTIHMLMLPTHVDNSETLHAAFPEEAYEHVPIAEVVLSDNYIRTLNKMNTYNRRDYPDGDKVLRLIYKSKTDNSVYYVTNFNNSAQVSYNQRTSRYLGRYTTYNADCVVLASLAPILFEELRLKLDANELALFRYLNDYASYRAPRLTEYYQTILTGTKYTDAARRAELRAINSFFSQQQNNLTEEFLRIENDIEQLYRRAEEKQERLMQMKLIEHNRFYNSESFQTEFQEYISNHPYIKRLSLYGASLRIQGVVPLTIWDNDLADNVAKNLEKHDLSPATTRAAEYFFKHVIGEQDVIYNCHYLVTIDSNLKVSARSYESTSIQSIGNTFEAGINPHIYHYSCIGNYGQQLSKANSKEDAIGALEVILNAFKSLNFADGTVVQRFLQNDLVSLLRADTKCLEKDGVKYSFRELINIEDGTQTEVIEEEDL